MAKTVNKNCLSCQKTFQGRRDAKTCSASCRQRLQRAAQFIGDEAERLKGLVAREIEELEASLTPQLVTSLVSVPVSAEESGAENIVVSAGSPKSSTDNVAGINESGSGNDKEP